VILPEVAMADESRRVKVVDRGAGPWGFFFVIAYVGAAVYFVRESDGGFWDVVLALLQAVVWPAYVVFHALQLIGA
jgi:hypothetical protein